MKAAAKTLFNILGYFLILQLVCCFKNKQWIQWEDNHEINRAAVYDIGKLWTNSTIYYKIHDDVIDDIGPLVKNAMTMIENHTCLQFIEWRGQYQDYIFIKDDLKCSSKLGRQGGKQNLYLSIFCRTVGQILHELLHSLGFWHEMSRNDRDDYIEIHWNNIMHGQDFNFHKLHPWEHNLLDTPFDYDSIMMYGSKAFALDSHEPTITPKTPGIILKDVEDKTRLSDIDIIRINRLYQCFGEKRPAVPDPPEYACDFENGDCDIITQSGSKVASWEKVNEPRGTLPGDHTTSGFGYYWVVNAENAAGKQAIMYMPQFPDNGRSKGCLSFFYHYRGPGTEAFIGIRQTVRGSSIIFSGSPTAAGTWEKASINVDLNISNFRIALVAVSTPTNQSGGIFAVDDVMFQWIPCK